MLWFGQATIIWFIQNPGVLLTTLNVELGQLVSVNKTYFCVAKEKKLFAYNEKGDIVGQRKLTEDELKELGM